MKDLQNTNNTITTTPKTYTQSELNRIKVFKYIEKHQPISRFKVPRGVGLAQNTVYYIVRDLVFSGVVHTELKINKDGTEFHELTVPKEVEE